MNYFIGNNDDNFVGLYHQFAHRNDNITTADADYILGAPNDAGTHLTGVLRYVISKLSSFLSSPGSISIRPDNDSGVPSYITYPAENKGSFYFGAFDGIDWNTQTMSETTVVSTPRFGIDYILSGRPTNIYVNNLTLERNILNLLDESTLECCFEEYVNTHLNIIEGLNIPTTNIYFNPTLTVFAGNIISYDSLSVTDINEKISETADCPQSNINIIFKDSSNNIDVNILYKNNYLFVSPIDDIENNPNTSSVKSSVKNMKYYCIALINYMLFSIIRQDRFSDLEIPPLDLTTIDFDFNNITTPNTYTYGSGNGNTIQLLYETFLWHNILSNSFYGTGSLFDPINIDDVGVCDSPVAPPTTWITTPLIKDFYYLQWIHNECYLEFLNNILKNDGLNKLILYALSIVKVPSIPDFPYKRLANLERVKYVNISKDDVSKNLE